jgi:hypothetical protein
VCSPSSPRGRGTASFYRPRGGSLQSCHTVLITSNGMVHSIVELMAVLANSVPAGRRGESYSRPGVASRGLCGDFSFGRRPYADSRVRLTGGRKVHSSRRGSVLSSWAPTGLGMAQQCLGWRHGSGDDRTGLMVTEKTRLTGLMSRCCPGRARDRRPSPFRGFHRPISRVWCAGRTRVGSIVSQS